MNYIYDIYLNLNKNAYDFFDWNKSDKIIRIKKIPIIRISKNQFNACINNKIKIFDKLYKTIYKKTECFNNKSISCVILTDSLNTIALEFNKNIEINRSFLQIDDELDTLEYAKSLPETKIKLNKLGKEKCTLQTRRQIKIKKFVRGNIKKLSDSEITFIYYECFNKKINKKENLINSIQKLDNQDAIYKKIFNILNLSSINKKKML